MSLKKIAPVTETASGTGWSVRKTGSVVELRIEGLDSQQVIPAQYVPTSQTYAPVSAQSTTTMYTPRITINEKGYITPQGYSGKGWGIITYTV